MAQVLQVESGNGDKSGISPAIVALLETVQRKQAERGVDRSILYWVEDCVERGAEAILRSIKYAAETRDAKAFTSYLTTHPEVVNDPAAMAKTMQKFRIGATRLGS